MKCGVPTSAYVCTNASGTTCTKLAFTAINLSANTTCLSTEYVILSQPEWSLLNTQAVNGQNASTTNTASIDSVRSDVSLLKAWSGVGASVPNTDVIQAESTLFAAVFVAAAVIWGVKQLFKTFRTEGVGHE